MIGSGIPITQSKMERMTRLLSSEAVQRTKMDFGRLASLVTPVRQLLRRDKCRDSGHGGCENHAEVEVPEWIDPLVFVRHSTPHFLDPSEALSQTVP